MAVQEDLKKSVSRGALVRTIFIVAVACLILSACNQVTLALQCDLDGAQVYENGVRGLGPCPQSLTYQITDEARKQGFVKTLPLAVMWPSGATASVPSVVMNLSAGSSFFFNFTRPTSAPNYEMDVRFALELRKIRLMQEAQRQQALNNLLLMYQNSQPQRPTVRNCDAIVTGNIIHTTCQ